MRVPFEQLDALGFTRDNITEQFRDKVIIDKYIQLLFHEKPEIQRVIQDLLQSKSIDEAKGYQLDVIGEIVGQPRVLESFDLYDYFGFIGAPNAKSFGDLDDPSVGGFFYSLGDPLGGNFVLTDEVYRFFLKAKIVKNNTASTPEDIIAFVIFLFGNIPVFLREGVAELTIFFGRPLSDFEFNLLNFISYDFGYASRFIIKTLGVRLRIAEFDSARGFFAFKGVPNAKGFGSLGGWGSGWDEYWDGEVPPLEGGYFASYR